ncbi:MAG: beta-ketoacyl synthase N-terminal-like domain-containing protein [Acidobacteriota bacterium]
MTRRAGVFGWGIVAPKSPNIDVFADNLEKSGSWLEAFQGYGPASFLVGTPEFDFSAYRDWLLERFPPNRFAQLESKMGMPTLYAVGSFIQALRQNEGIEAELQSLGPRCQVLIGTGLGDVATADDQSRSYWKAQRRWDRFWSDPERNAAARRHAESPDGWDGPEPPPHPDSVDDPEDRLEAEDRWWSFWASQSDQLGRYLEQLCEIEGAAVEGDIEKGKLATIKAKRRGHARLAKEWGAPTPPWLAVSANLIWNIHNIPAAQVSMLGKITGMAMAPVAACSTFGVALHLGLSAIRSGEADAVVVGATDPPPHPLTVGAFHAARVIAADGQVSKPLTQLRGTHVAGGSVVWILGELEHMKSRGFQPLGLEPVAVGVTSDADHIITPSQEGPSTAVKMALEAAAVDGDDLGSWDLHATATPGDYNEMELLKSVVTSDVLVSARKGSFGHGMSAGGGWELTAQYLAHERGHVLPTALSKDELHEAIGGLHGNYVFDEPLPLPTGPEGKLSMGIGGINACVISRPHED